MGGVATQAKSQNDSGKTEEAVKQNDGETSEKNSTDEVVDPSKETNEVKVDTDKLDVTKSGNLTEEQLSKLLGASFVAKASTDKTNSDYISYKDAQKKVDEFNSKVDTQLTDATGTAAINKLFDDYNKNHPKNKLTSAEKKAINAAVADAIKKNTGKETNISTAITTTDIDKNESDAKKTNGDQITAITKQIKQYINDYVKYESDLSSYSSAKNAYIKKIKDLGLWEDGVDDPTDLSQLLSLKDEKQAKVTVRKFKATKTNVTEETGTIMSDDKGNPLLTRFYHVNGDTNDKFLKVIYTNLKNSTYKGKHIRAMVVTYSDFKESNNSSQNGRTPGIYFGNNPLDGFFYVKANSVTVDIKMYYDYDKKSKQPKSKSIVNLEDNSAYFTAESLNSKGKGSDYVEKAQLLSDGKGLSLPESSVTVHGKKTLYSDKNNSVMSGTDPKDTATAKEVWGKKIVKKYSNWDVPSSKNAIFGSGVFKVTGKHIQIKYSNKRGSAWAPFSTNIPKLTFKETKPTPPSLKITWNPSELNLHDGKDITETDKRTRDVIDNFNNQEKVIDTQNVILTRTKTVDSVTGKATYSNWKIADGNNGYVTYTPAPSHTGYAVSSINNQAISDIDVINFENKSGNDKKDDPIIFNFNANSQEATVTYIDDTTGKTLQTIDLAGVSGANSGYNTIETKNNYVNNQYYKVVSDDTDGENIIFDHDDSKVQRYEVRLKHTFSPIEEHHTIKETIHYQLSDGTPAFDDYAANVKFDRTGQYDKVLNQNSWDAWQQGDSQTFVSVTSPTKQGYTPSQSEITAITVVPNADDITKTVVYTPDAQKAMVNYIDDTTNETLKTKTLNGVSDADSGYNTKDTIADYVDNQHYKLVSDSTNGKNVVFDHDDNFDQVYNVHLKHDTQPVNPHDPIPEKSEVKKKDLQESVERTITYHYADGHRADESTASEVINFEGSGTIDKVTGQLVELDKDHNIIKNSNGTIKEGKITWVQTNTSEDLGKFENINPYETPNKPDKGYSLSKITITEVKDDGTKLPAKDITGTEIPSKIVNHISNDIEVVVTYAPDAQEVLVEYIDDDASDVSKEVITKSPILKGVTGKKSDYSTVDTIKALESKGYVHIPDKDTVPADGIVFDNDDDSDQVYYVHFKHGTQPVNPHDIPEKSDVKPEELTKSVTRTITYHYADGHRGDESTAPEVINFEGSGTIDKVTGNLVKLDDKGNIIKESNTSTKEGKITWVKKDGTADEGKFYAEIPVSPLKGYSVSRVAVDDTIVNDTLNDKEDGTKLIPSATVKHDDPNIVVVVTYAPDPQQAMVEYLDDDANEEVIAQSLLLKGVTGEKSDYSTADTIEALKLEGYKLVSDDTKEGITLDNDDNSDQIYYVHLKHDTQPVNPHDPIPEKSEVKKEDLQESVKRTITYHYADEHCADESTTPEVINFEGSGTIDKVTGQLVELDKDNNIVKNSDGTIKEGKITWVNKVTPKGEEPSDTGKFHAEIPVSPLKGYSVTEIDGKKVDKNNADSKLIPSATVKHDDPNIVVVVTYAPDPQQAMVEYLDDDANEEVIAQSPILKGVTGEKSDYSTADTIEALKSEGYKLVSDDTKEGITFDNDDNSDQIYYVHLKHDTVPVNPRTPDKDIPDTSDVKPEKLIESVTRTITYHYVDGHRADESTAPEVINFEGSGTIDKVTGKLVELDENHNIVKNSDGTIKEGDVTWVKKYTAKDEGKFYEEIPVSPVNGYSVTGVAVDGTSVDGTRIPAKTVEHTSDDIVVVVTYAPDPQQAMVEYVDDTEDSVISQQLLRGKTGEKNNYSTKSTIHDLTSEGYVLVSDGVPTDGIVFDNDDNSDQVYYVHLKHGIKEVDKDHPGKPDTPITPTDDPKDPHGPNYPKGSYEENLTDDVTRTINYIYSTTDAKGNNLPVIGEDGKPMVVTQAASFSAVGYLDTVTGKWVDQDGNEVEKGKELTWSPASAKLDTVISPIEAGYIASQRKVEATTVKTGDNDQAVTVIYTPVAQKAHIKFVDDDSGETGTVLGTEDLDGHTDESIKFKNAPTTLQNYLNDFDFVSLVDETPQITPKHSLMLFAATPYVANKSQQLLTTDAQKALTYNLGKFNNDADTDQQFVVHLKHHFEDKTRTRTVHQHVEYLYGEGANKGHKLPADIAQDFDKDLTYSENGKVDTTYEAYHKGRSTNPIENKTTWDENTIKQVSFDTVNSPKVSGYHFDKDKVDPDDVTINNKNWDSKDLDVKDQVRYYANPQTAHIKFYDDTSKKFVKGDDGEDFEEVAKGKTGEEITLRNSLPRTRKALHSIMDENDHTLPYLPQFNMFDVSDTDHITDTSDSRKLADESSVQDHIGNFDDNDDRSQLFIIHVKLPDPTPQPDPKPTPAPETHKITVTYKDDVTGETLSTKSFNGKSGESANYSTVSTINTLKTEGYTLNSDETNGQPLTFSDNDQSYLVELGHDTQEVTTHKTITRTIIGKTPNGDDINVKQPVTLTKVDTQDKVTGEITKQGTWNTGTWNKYDVPQFDGYTSQIEGKDGVQVTEKGVTSDTPDEVVHVSYVAIPSPVIPTPIPDPTPTTPSEDPQPTPQPTDPTSTPTQPSGEKKEVSQAPTPKTPKKKPAQPAVSKKVVVTPTIKKPAKTVSVTEKVATRVAKATLSKKQATAEKQNTLPQTGAKDENLAGMLGLMIASVGAIFGLAAGKKRKND